MTLHPTQPEALEPGTGLFEGLGAAHPAQEQRKRDVFLGAQLGHELAELEDEAEAIATQRTAFLFPQGVDAIAGEPDLAGVGGEYASETMEQGRLARAARAHDSENFPSGDSEIGPAQRRRLPEGQHSIFRLEDGGAPCDRLGEPIRAHDRTSSANTPSRAAVRSIQRRSASRWNRPWSARRASTTGPFRLSSVSSLIRMRWALRWVSR